MIIRERDIRLIVRQLLAESGKSGSSGSKTSGEKNSRPTKDKSFVVPENPQWSCWTRKLKDTRAEAGTLAWREDVMRTVWRDNGLPSDSDEAESVRDAAEKYLANNRYDTLFSAETDTIFGYDMSLILKAMAAIESRMNAKVNKGNGRGLMQLTQDAIDQIKIVQDKKNKRNNPKVDPFIPEQAVKGAAEYIRWLIPRPVVVRGKLPGMLTAYNSGPYAESKVDPFYSNKVMAMMDLLYIFDKELPNGGKQFEGLRRDLFRA